MIQVAPPAGAWIETFFSLRLSSSLIVAPPAGAWIETPGDLCCDRMERVAPPAGAWIETRERPFTTLVAIGRAPRGRVD